MKGKERQVKIFFLVFSFSANFTIKEKSVKHKPWLMIDAKENLVDAKKILVNAEQI